MSTIHLLRKAHKDCLAGVCLILRFPFLDEAAERYFIREHKKHKTAIQALRSPDSTEVLKG